MQEQRSGVPSDSASTKTHDKKIYWYLFRAFLSAYFFLNLIADAQVPFFQREKKETKKTRPDSRLNPLLQASIEVVIQGTSCACITQSPIRGD